MKKAILLLLLGAGVCLLLCSCTETRRRAFIRRDASVTDYTYFPQRVIPRGNFVRVFTEASDPAVISCLLTDLSYHDMEAAVAATKTQAFIIIRDNVILLETYGAGCSRDSTVTSFSVAKSFNSAMIGCLLADSVLPDVRTPVTLFVPELKTRDVRFASLTVQNLLTMSSGLVYEDASFFRADDTETYFNPDLRSLALNRTTIEEVPGVHFRYNNYNPLLLGLIIERAAGMPVSSYLSQSIWSKIGAEADASWSLDSTRDSFEKMESGINGRALDFARFGCLYRDHGRINGIQVVSPGWIEESLREINNQESYYADSWGKQIYRHGCYYALGWYVVRRPGFENDFFAFGNKGQIIYISPAAHMVIVRFGTQYGIDPWKYLETFHAVCTMSLSAGR
jgi:CubicO group peptidase (beta-lactamase class C family)